MKTKRNAICIIALLLTITIITSGCSNSQKSALSKVDLDAKIAKMLPSAVQVAGSSTHSSVPLSFQASVDGSIYYIGSGDILLNTQILKGDIIKLNYWSGLPAMRNTQITINDEMVYHNPTTRHGDNRFYFFPDPTPQDLKPESTLNERRKFSQTVYYRWHIFGYEVNLFFGRITT